VALWVQECRGSKNAKLGKTPTLGENGAPNRAYGRHRVSKYQSVDILTSEVEGPMVEFRLAGRSGEESVHSPFIRARTS
jgi:hypothetical protein